MTAHTTWDGMPIAAGAPQGSAIVIRRHTDTGWQYPILHRATHGSGYDGMWAWTPPSGMRQPGEGAHTSAMRELAEETGLTNITIHPVDLARGHALWTATLNDTHTITLDHEHDRFAWLDAQAAVKRCRPGVVGENITTVEPIPDTDFTFQPTADGYDITADGTVWGTAHHHAITDNTAFYDTVGHRNAAIIEYTLTDPTNRDQGSQPRLIWTFLRDIVLPAHPQAATVWATIDPADTTTLRTYAKAGFTHDGITEIHPGRPVAICGLRLSQWW